MNIQSTVKYGVGYEVWGITQYIECTMYNVHMKKELTIFAWKPHKCVCVSVGKTTLTV